MDNHLHHCKLKKFAFGLSIGLVWAFGVFIMGIIDVIYGFGHQFVDAVGTLYYGYEGTVLGSIIGAGWALLDGFIFGFLIAWLYNLFSCCCKCPVHKDSE